MAVKNCVNPKCFSPALPFHRLCGVCNNLAEAAMIVGVCLGGSFLIIAAMRVFA